MKKILFFSVIIIIFIFFFHKTSRTSKKETFKNTPMSVILSRSSENQISKNSRKLDSIIDMANNYIENNKSALGIREYHKLIPTLYRSPINTTVKYYVYQDELPIVGFEFLLNFNESGQLTSIKKNYFGAEKVDFKMPINEGILESLYVQHGLKKENSHISYVLIPRGDKLELAVAVSGELLDDNKKVNLLISVNDGFKISRTFPRKEF